MKSLNTAKQYFALCLLTCSAAFADQASHCSMQDSSMHMNVQSIPDCDDSNDTSMMRAPRIPGPGNPPVTDVPDVVYGDFYITKNLFVKGSIETGCNIKLGGCVDLSNCCNVNVCHPEPPVPPLPVVLNVGGVVQATNYQTVSDSRLKEDIKSMDTKECLKTVLGLKPKSFVFKEQFRSVYGLPSERQMGFVAQEVEKVMPDAVMTSSVEKEHGISQPKAIKAMAMIPVLVGAVQECMKEINMLRAEIMQLKKQR